MIFFICHPLEEKHWTRPTSFCNVVFFGSTSSTPISLAAQREERVKETYGECLLDSSEMLLFPVIVYFDSSINFQFLESR
jgi:hypothetical protein